MSYLKQKPKLPIGTLIDGYPSVEKALHSDRYCEVYLLKEYPDFSLLFVLLSDIDKEKILKWWEQNRVEYSLFENVMTPQTSLTSIQAVIKVPGKWLGDYSLHLNKRGWVNFLLTLIHLTKTSKTFENAPNLTPSLLWISVNKEITLSSPILSSKALSEADIISSVGKTFYAVATGIRLDENEDSTSLSSLSRWCANAGSELSGLIRRCIDQSVSSLSEIEDEVKTFVQEDSLMLSHPDRIHKAISKTSSIHTKPEGGGFEKVAGMQELKELLIQEVIDPIRDPEPYKKYGLTIPNGILLFGPPGCGKTYIAMQLAEELGYYFAKIIPSEVGSPYTHQSVLNIRDIFETAAEKAPAILFIDEFEALVPSRSELGGHQHYKAEEVNEFLSQLNECADKNIIVIAATNEPEKIDFAILRTGRFDKLIYVGPPDELAREEMLRLHLENRPIEKGIDLAKLSKYLEGYSASDIKFLVDESARLAMRNKSSISNETILTVKEKIPASITDEVANRYKTFTSRGI